MLAKSGRAIQHWWVTASERNQGHPWHWKQFYDDHTQGFCWGGPDWINSKVSFARIKEMRKGDIVVAYQANEGIVGLIYLAKSGYQCNDGGDYDTFDLKPTPKIWLDHPVPYGEIKALPNAKENIEFVLVKQGTVFRINSAGFDQILDLILKFNFHLNGKISDFLSLNQLYSEAEAIAVDNIDELKPTRKATFTVQRTIRNSAVGKSLKHFYHYECQVCGATIELLNGKRYAEAHHLRPVGKPHNGKDGKPNVIVVCPHHHALFDLGVIAINPDTLIVEHWNPNASEHGLSLIVKHRLDKASLNYHYRKLFKGTIKRK